MALFLSTYVNKVDKKGRVSVPASFRETLKKRNSDGLVVFKSPNLATLECVSTDYLEKLSEDLEEMDIFSPDYDSRATTIFGAAVPLSIDGDGRILLPSALITYAAITEQAAFVGLARKFQIWEPSALEKHISAARKQMGARHKDG